MAFGLEGRTAIVTGASRGIGRALALGLVAKGARVVAVGRDGEALSALAREGSGRVVTVIADLGAPGAATTLASRTEAEFPDASVLVNNAGVQTPVDFLVSDVESVWPAMRAEIAVNFEAVVELSLRLLPLMAHQPSAAIVNLTTGLTLAPKKGAPVYCATKFGVAAFTRSLRYQCEDRAPHVRIVEALPPIVDTGMTAGRGRDKISAERCASEILRGLESGRPVIDVGKTRLLRLVSRISPTLAFRIMRNG